MPKKSPYLRKVDHKWNLYKVVKEDGTLSDTLNLTRAKDLIVELKEKPKGSFAKKRVNELPF